MKNVKVVVATHLKYIMPEDSIYIPMQVGKEGRENLGYQPDNTGDNISEKNPYYSELTGLYWAWKNLDADYIGLVHYRRHFSSNRKIFGSMEDKVKSAISGEKIDKILDSTDIILPKKRYYFIENLYSHYKHTMYIEPLDEMRNIIEEKYPNYLKEFDKLHKRTSAHMFNMFIMKRDKLDAYCTWLFDILFELEKKVDITQYDIFHARFFGRIAELLLDVWIRTNKLNYKEINYLYIEKVNWPKKIYAFLKAKFLGEKYRKEFLI